MYQVVETSQNFLDYAWKISRFLSWLMSSFKSASQATPGWKPPHFNCQCFYSITSQYWRHYVFVTCASSGFYSFMRLCIDSLYVFSFQMNMLMTSSKRLLHRLVETSNCLLTMLSREMFEVFILKHLKFCFIYYKHSGIWCFPS